MFTNIRFYLHIHVLVYPFYLAHLKRPCGLVWDSKAQWSSMKQHCEMKNQFWTTDRDPAVYYFQILWFKLCAVYWSSTKRTPSSSHWKFIYLFSPWYTFFVAEKLQINNNHSLVSVFEFCHSYPSLKVNFTHSDLDRFSFPKCILLPGYNMPRIINFKP